MSGAGLTRANVVRLVLLAGMWGASFLFMKLALDGMNPAQIVLGRLTAAAVTLAAVLVIRGQRLPDRRLWGHLALMGVVGNIVPFFLFAWGEQYVTSGMAGVLNGTTPLFTMVIAAAMLPSERLSPVKVLGLLIGFVGVVLVVGPWRGEGTSALSGQLACLGAAVCYGVTFAYTRRYITGRGAVLPLSVGQLGAAALMLWLVSPLVAWEPMVLTPRVLGSVLALGMLGTGVAYLLYYRLITDAGATTASMVTYLIPVFAVVLGVVVLSEPLAWNLFVGAGVVILGVAIADGRLSSRRRDGRVDEVVGVDTPVVCPEDEPA